MVCVSLPPSVTMGRWRRGRWRQRFNRSRQRFTGGVHQLEGTVSRWISLRWRRRCKMKESHTHIMDEGGYWHSLNDLLKRWQEASSQGRFDLQVIEALEARFEQYCHAQILRHLADSVRV